MSNDECGTSWVKDWYRPVSYVSSEAPLRTLDRTSSILDDPPRSPSTALGPQHPTRPSHVRVKSSATSERNLRHGLPDTWETTRREEVFGTQRASFHKEGGSTSEKPIRDSMFSGQSSLDEPSGLKNSMPTTLSWRFYASFGCLCVVNLVCALDATSLSVALPTIAQKLNGTAIEAFWSGTSFLLTSTVFQPSWAQFSHIFGRKPMLLSALFLFTIGAIVCGLAKNFTVLLIGRCVQGAGGGGIVALTYVITTDLVTLRERGKWFGLISMQWAIGSVTGPIVGGAFAQKASWRWIFWINLFFCVPAFICIPLFLRLAYIPTSWLQKLRRVDWFGSFIFISSLTSFLIPITWGGIMYPWSSWRVLVPLVLGAGGIVAFIIYSRFVPAEPLIRGSIFVKKSALVSYAGTVLHGTILWSILYYLPLYYQSAKHFSPILSGVAVLPQTFTVAPSSVIIGLLITRTGRYLPFVLTGWALTTLGMGLLVLLKTETTTVSWIFLNLVSGLGLGILYPAMSFAIQAASTDADLPFAAAMFSFFRALGQAIGVAVGGSVFQNSMRKKLAASSLAILRNNADAYSRDASSLVQVVKQLPLLSEERIVLVHAYVDSLRTVWIVMCALAGLALVLAVVGTREEGLDRELKTEQGFRHEGEKRPDMEQGRKGSFASIG